MNLRRGIDAPASGSIAVNGEILAEQIGGQIFIDVWGLLWPGNLEKAALYAERAASVSHDRNGIYGARFMAACIAKAFETSRVKEMIEAALEMIPGKILYMLKLYVRLWPFMKRSRMILEPAANT